jgi:hypothetical protein
MSRPRWPVALAAAAALLALPGCSGSSPDAGPALDRTQAATGGDDAEVDACALLTKAEIAAVLEVEVSGTGSGGSCHWEDENTYNSVTLDIGDARTAADGTLPDPLPGAKVEPGPDGIRYSSGNVAEFIVDGRACQVQVVTKVTDESDRPAAVRLIGLVRDRMGK